MEPDLNTVLDAAMKLPLRERRRLIAKLSISSRPDRVAGAVEKHFGTLRSDDPTAGDNEKIDAELAAAYHGRTGNIRRLND